MKNDSRVQDTLKQRLLGTDAEDLPFFPAAEVAKHNTLHDLWVVIDGKVYDITAFVPKHPGGAAPVMYGGKDVTRVFHKVHNKGVLDRHREYIIGTTDIAEASDDVDGDAQDLPFFPAAEVAKHNTLDDLWIAIDGKVYDITALIPKHPGGTAPLIYGGKDVTRVFHEVHNKGVLDRHREYIIGTTDIAEASDGVAGVAVQNSTYDTKADPDGYDVRKAKLTAKGKWGAGREFGDHMAEEGEMSHIPTIVFAVYAVIFGWSMLAHWITGCNWWTMCAFYMAMMIAFYTWHRMAHADWTGEMHEVHMEHHLVRFPATNFYGSAENFARNYPEGRPTIWTLMNPIRSHVGAIPLSASTSIHTRVEHTPMVHERLLFIFMALIIVVAYFACKCTVGTLCMASVEIVVMVVVGNSFHLSFHVREFHLEKYSWYKELRTLHYIHHLGEMKQNFNMVNMGLETVFGSLAIADPAHKSKSESVTEILASSPLGDLPSGISKEGLASATQHFGFSSAVLGMDTPEAPRKTSLAVKRGYPTVLLRILLICVSVRLWFWSERSLSISVATGDSGPSLEDPGQELFDAGYSISFLKPLCVTSCLASEVTVLICILTSCFGTTVRPFLSLVIVFLLRLLMRACGALLVVRSTEPVSSWVEPESMPRLFVSPLPESNLFFSGRVAVATIACCELLHFASDCQLTSQCRTLAVRGFLVLLSMTYLLGTVWLSLATSSSWSFDCVIAFATASYSSFAAKRYSGVIDSNMP